MPDDIQFGDLEHAEPHRALRPDEDRQFVVASLGSPARDDLAIFVDLNVHAEMDRHAASNTSVELGGVLLGRACRDERGQPFVVVSGSIRAEHYESTKGSFKFTHDTWSAITRERERAAPDLAIVGWYHTHPGWGVFLSGMDLFICENFFNQPLDIAYVIDPCRHDRGMFQWTDAASPDNDRSVRRTAGYYLFSSRFRKTDLQAYAAELNTRPAATPSQPSETLAWQTLAVVAMFTAYLLLIASSDAASPSTWLWPGGFALAVAALLAIARRFATRAQAPYHLPAT